jgi:signal transduction histidine kinase
LGLVGMRERAALAGGHAEIQSRPGAGTTVTVTMPRSAAADAVPA